MSPANMSNHRFPRLVLQKQDPLGYKQIEMQTLKVGIWINILMGLCGWVGYYFASSYALALDGSLCTISAVSFIVALRITRKREVRSEEYPFGIYSVENVYAMLQGILLIAITVFSIFESIGSIISYIKSGPTILEPLKLTPLLIYTIGMVFACAGVWLYYRRQLEKTAGESPILKSETVAAYVDTFVTVGTGLALILMAIVPQDSPFAFLNYIGDSIIVIGISLFLLPPPIRVVSHSFFSLIGRTTQNAALRNRTEAVIKAALDPSFKLVKVLLFHVGSSYEVDITITPQNDAQMNLEKYRESRSTIEAELKKLYPNLVLQIFLL